MENRPLYAIFVIALIGAVLFLGATITGLVVQKTGYEDLCRTDSDCALQKCCIIYQDKGLGLCMNDCQSLDVLCKSDAECADGTVCCLSDGREYGICNDPDKCLSIGIFAEYLTNNRQAGTISPTTESPMKIEPRSFMIAEALIIIALIAFILWRLSRERKIKK